VETSEHIEVTCELTFSENLRAAWDLATGSFADIAWMCAFPVAGLILASTMVGSDGNGSLWVYLFLIWCFGFLPCTFLWNAFGRYRTERALGPYTYRFAHDGVYIETATIDVTRRWPGVVRVRKNGVMLHVYAMKNRADSIPLRALPPGGVELILKLASAGGVKKVEG